jgi:hypothetical protein
MYSRTTSKIGCTTWSAKRRATRKAFAARPLGLSVTLCVCVHGVLCVGVRNVDLVTNRYHVETFPGMLTW